TYINRTVINNTNVSRVSYNGGSGGIRAVPSAQERSFEHERHFEATSDQGRHQDLARGNRNQLYSANHGRPIIAASPKAGVYEGHGVEASRNYNRANNSNNVAHNNVNNNSTFKGNGQQGGNRNFDRSMQNRSVQNSNVQNKTYNNTNRSYEGNTNRSYSGNTNRSYNGNANPSYSANTAHVNNGAVVNNHGNASHSNYSRDNGGHAAQNANNNSAHGEK